ncbi:MAG: TRAP transporter substrate-binding protein [Desulfobacula sp.]|nr:TRAP transporter substrate-binding protein [Desulfobacula sp.]
MKKITFITFLAICISALFAFNASAKTQLTYANFFPPQHGQSKLAESWCKEVEKRTNGEVTFKYYPSSTLLNPGTMYDGVINGIADVGFTVLAYSRGRFTVAAGIDLPLGYTSGVQATKIANAVFNKFQPKEFSDTKVMYLHAHGPGVLHTSDQKVANLGDLKGLKIRGTGTSGLIVGALGGSAVGKSMRESYTMLQKGVVDGSLHPLEADKGWKLGEVVHYAVQSAATSYTTTFAVFMNKSRWNKLTPEQQKIITKINAEWSVKHGKVWDSDDVAGTEFFKSKGGKIITLSADEEAKWKAAVAPVIDGYIQKAGKKGVDGKAVVDFIKANM